MDLYLFNDGCMPTPSFPLYFNVELQNGCRLAYLTFKAHIAPYHATSSCMMKSVMHDKIQEAFRIFKIHNSKRDYRNLAQGYYNRQAIQLTWHVASSRSCHNILQRRMEAMCRGKCRKYPDKVFTKSDLREQLAARGFQQL